MVCVDDYNTLVTDYNSLLADYHTTLVVSLIVLVLWIIFLALYQKERQRRRTLQAELDRQQDPAYQLAVIQTLGEAGRKEMQRTVAQAQRALANFERGAQP